MRCCGRLSIRGVGSYRVGVGCQVEERASDGGLMSGVEDYGARKYVGKAQCILRSFSSASPRQHLLRPGRCGTIPTAPGRVETEPAPDGGSTHSRLLRIGETLSACLNPPGGAVSQTQRECPVISNISRPVPPFMQLPLALGRGAGSESRPAGLPMARHAQAL